jgi:hypothetical protein
MARSVIYYGATAMSRSVLARRRKADACLLISSTPETAASLRKHRAISKTAGLTWAASAIAWCPAALVGWPKYAMLLPFA